MSLIWILKVFQYVFIMDRSILSDTHPPGLNGYIRKKIRPGGGEFGSPRGPPGEFGNQTDFANFTFRA